jgi:hypothetical protein
MVRRDVIVSRREVAVAFSPRAPRARLATAPARLDARDARGARLARGKIAREPRRDATLASPAKSPRAAAARPPAPPRSYESPRPGADIRFSLVSRSTLLFLSDCHCHDFLNSRHHLRGGV